MYCMTTRYGRGPTLAIRSYCYSLEVSRRATSDVSRQQIAYAVWATISEHGVQGATMRRVAAAGQLSVGRIQHHFATREQMLSYACQAMVDLAASYNSTESTTRGGVDDTDSSTDSDQRAALEEARRLLVHRFNQSPEYRLGARVWAAFAAHAVVDPAIAAVVVKAQLGFEHEIARLLARAGRDPGHARRLVALSEGLAQRTLTGALSADQAVGEVDDAIDGGTR